MESDYRKVAGGVCAPLGFYSGAVSAGIKKADSRKKDLALIYSDGPAIGVAVFTTSRVKAAPVKVSTAHLRSNDTRAVIANAGNANACTGVRGIEDAKRMASETAAQLRLRPSQVLVCSTGIIGVPMPIDRISAKIPQLVSEASRKGGQNAARAIMTSDSVPKSISISLKVGSTKVRIGAMAKGAGMICPSMATMLCFVTTDARIDKGELRKATLEAVEGSFNRISVDGDMSTNDSVIVLANGQAKNRPITNGSPAASKFREALGHVMLKLAIMIVRDGERVTKFVEIQVKGARTYLDARKVAEAVANSTLVKCSWNGSDPNWGRVMDAVGYSRAKVREEMIDIYFDGVLACQHGIAADTPLSQLQKLASKDSFRVLINLNSGDAEHTVYTSDLSPEYVEFNRAEYALGRATPGK